MMAWHTSRERPGLLIAIAGVALAAGLCVALL